jgi:predicted O-methyltransferase YrrM
MGLAAKFSTLAWYLGDAERMVTLPSLLRRVLAPDAREKTQTQATAQCEAEAIPLEAALASLAPGYKPVDFFAVYAGQIAAAHQRCDASPVRMGGPGDLGLAYNLAEAVGAERVIETGVAYGWSTLALLLSLSHRPGSRLVSIDMPYAKAGNEPYVGVAVPDELRPHWTLLRKPDRAGLPEALRLLGQIDLCHYDSDKSYTGRMFAYPKLWAALKPGGLFITDDIQDNLAFFEFADALKLPRVVIASQGKFVGAVRKPA